MRIKYWRDGCSNYFLKKMTTRYHLGKIQFSEVEREILEKFVEQFETKFSHLEGDELKVDVKVIQDRRQKWTVGLDIKTPQKLFRAKKDGFEFKTVLDKLEEAIDVQIRKIKVR